MISRSGGADQKGSTGCRPQTIAVTNHFVMVAKLQPAEQRRPPKPERAEARGHDRQAKAKAVRKSVPSSGCGRQRGRYFDDDEVVGPAAASWPDLGVNTTYDGNPITLK